MAMKWIPKTAMNFRDRELHSKSIEYIQLITCHEWQYNVKYLSIADKGGTICHLSCLGTHIALC